MTRVKVRLANAGPESNVPNAPATKHVRAGITTNIGTGVLSQRRLQNGEQGLRISDPLIPIIAGWPFQLKILSAFRKLSAMNSGTLLILVAVFSIGCGSFRDRTGNSRDDGSSIGKAALISGATDEQMLVSAEERWIRTRFPSAIIEARGLAFDPMTGFVLGSSVPADARVGHFCDRVEFRTRHGEAKVAYFAYDPTLFRDPPEDLSLLDRCIEMIQNRTISRGMTVGALQQHLRENGWVDGKNLFFSEHAISAALSFWRPALSLYPGNPPPAWSISFITQDGIVVDYCLSKDRGK